MARRVCDCVLILIFFATGSDGVTDEIDNWSSGIEFEMNHWDKWLCGAPCDPEGQFAAWREGVHKRQKDGKLAGQPIEPFRSWMCDVITGHAKRSVKTLLDHGAGPFTSMGVRFTCPAQYPLVDAMVQAVDPLAPHYHALLNRFSIHNTLRTQRCASEELVACFGQETIDASIIINALDHSKAAVIAWENVLRVTAIGGIACVFSAINESKHMQGQGFHQWDFYLGETDAWIITNTLNKKSTNIDQLFARYSQPVYANTFADNTFLKCYLKTVTMIGNTNTPLGHLVARRTGSRQSIHDIVVL